MEKLNDIKLGSAALLIMVSYVLGFSMTPIGKFLYQKIGFKLWPHKLAPGNSELSISDKFVLVREYSEDNFKYIETWNMFCNLAHNLAFCMLVLLISTIYRIIFIPESSDLVFIIVAILAFVLFLLFLHRATVFRLWAMNDLNATVDRLRLDKK